MKPLVKSLFAAALLMGASGSALAQTAVSPKYQYLTFGVFAAIIALTMYVTYVAAKKVKTSADFYAAGGGI